MRLICPNCDAQYEVDDAVIPDSGRDVQCSNCGQTWFQRPAHLDPELAEDLGLHPSEADAEAEREPEPSPADTEYVEDEEADEQPEVAESASDEASAPRGAKRRDLDPAIANLLREEAEREADVRRKSTEALETQSELGLVEGEDAAHGGESARARTARIQREQEASVEPDAWEELAEAEPDYAPEELLDDVDEEVMAARRGSLLPDIDEVSTEPPDGPEASESLEVADAEESAAARRSGFSGGFLLVLLLVLIAVAFYAFAPQIAERLPEGEQYLVAYVDWINAIREQIDQAVEASIAKISELIDQYTG